MSMVLRDKLVGWFIRNVILPKTAIIDKPGFVVAQFSKESEILYLRQICLPEMLFSNIEIELINEANKRGEELLYQTGKKFGYIYASISQFPTRSFKIKDFVRFAHILVKHIECVWAKRITHNINIKVPIFIMRMKEYIICRKNGAGHLLSTGGVAGIWAYACEDQSIEAIQIKCQGRGDKECEVIAAPYKTLVRMGYKPIRCRKLEKAELSREYKIFNEIRPTSWARNSLKSLIDAGFFDYKHGQVTYHRERFFLCEASFMYILEKELKKIKNGLKILWDCSFDFGKRLAEISGKQEPCKFIMDFFPALGFGDILASRKEGRYEIFVKYFPWLEWYKDIDFTMFRGMLSGIISGFTDRDVKLKKIVKDIRGRDFILYLTEK
ncbi:MAG: hypothetical protein QW631_00130 [Candidatus Aenigmatarchaeota archaeon]